MKLVTFGRAMAPHGVGDTRLMPDLEAKRLYKEGMLSAIESWPKPVDGGRQQPKPQRPAGVPDNRRAEQPR